MINIIQLNFYVKIDKLVLEIFNIPQGVGKNNGI